MTMTIEQARAIRRDPIIVGERYPFYATMVQEYDPPERRIRNYTGQTVLVIGWTNEAECMAEDRAVERGDLDTDDRTMEPTYKVRADNGHEFEALQGELNGWHKDTGQYVKPSGEWA